MDSVNLSGTQNTPSDCKSYAGFRNPAGCACCGLKDYPQNIPQAYCFTALCPGLSKCKPSQDHPQDNFAIPHPFFSSFPFQQHFFHSSIIPPNYCCPQKLLGDEDTNPGLMQSRNEHKINQHQAVPPQKEKSDFAGTNRNINEDAQKNNPVLGSDTTSPYSNPTESQPNTVFQRCVCGDCIPWSYRPLIVPVLSYCFLWNSQATASSLLSKTYNGYLAETLCQKNSKKQANQKSSCASDCQEQLHTLNQEPEKAACDNNHDSVELSQKCSEVSKTSKTEEQEEEKVQTELGEEKIQTELGEEKIQTEQEEEKVQTEQEENECMKIDSDGNFEEEEDESETGDDSEIRDETESEESLKVDENDNPAPDSSENLSKDLECPGSPQTESSTNFKSSEDSLSDALSETPANCWETEVKDVNLPVVTSEEFEEKNSDSEEQDASKTNLKEVVIKKCIKNFTVTNNINEAPSTEMQMSAAGDVGGETCDNCKILTSLDENSEEMSKESFKTGVSHEESEPKVSHEGDRRNVKEIHRSGYKFKSGIAKLSNNSNLKSPKSSTLKTTKKCKNNCNEKQSNVVRLRHCCFPTENTNSKHESPSKTQKSKKFTVVQNSAPGKSSVLPKSSKPEIQKKSLNTRQTLKKENSRKPARSVNLPDNSQKAVKTLLKK